MRFLYIHGVIISITAILLWQLFPVGGALDQALILPYVSSTDGFYATKDWWFDRFAHHDLKLWQELILLGILICWLIHRWKKITVFTDIGRYAAILGMMICTTALIGILKHYSAHACPWDLLTLTPYPHFDLTLGHGGCFPGGHAGLGYAWLAGFFVFYHQDKSRAYFYLATGMILGTGMGLTQMFRGAHFLSHNLWTLWVTWSVDFGLWFTYLMIREKLHKRIIRPVFD